MIGEGVRAGAAMASDECPNPAASAPENGSANAALPACRSQARSWPLVENHRHDDLTPDGLLSRRLTGISGCPQVSNDDGGTPATFRDDFSRRFSTAGDDWSLGGVARCLMNRIAADNPRCACGVGCSPHVATHYTSRGETLMAHSKNVLRQLMSAVLGDSPPPKRRRTRQITPMIDGLEDRVVLSHVGGFHHHHAHHAASVQTSTASTASTVTASDDDWYDFGTTTSTSSSSLSTRLARRSITTSRPSSWPPARRSAS